MFLNFRKGFTLLELVIVMTVLIILMTLLFSIYNVMLNNISIGSASTDRQRDLMIALYSVEDSARLSEVATANTPQALTLLGQALTVNYYLKPSSLGYTLWISRINAGNSSEQPLCEGIISPNTAFQISGNEVLITLNAQTATSNSIKIPINFMVVSRILLRNGIQFK